MQTFLPYPDIVASAQALDRQRLGKQRLEARQIIGILEGVHRGWKNHPAVLMWRGHTNFLRLYFNAVSSEWVRRGYQHTMGYYPNHKLVSCCDPPWWFGDDRLHSSHRSVLLFKEIDRGEPPWYIHMPWSESPSYRYWWPTVPEDVESA